MEERIDCIHLENDGICKLRKKLKTLSVDDPAGSMCGLLEMGPVSCRDQKKFPAREDEKPPYASKTVAKLFIYPKIRRYINSMRKLAVDSGYIRDWRKHKTDEILFKLIEKARDIRSDLNLVKDKERKQSIIDDCTEIGIYAMTIAEKVRKL